MQRLRSLWQCLSKSVASLKVAFYNRRLCFPVKHRMYSWMVFHLGMTLRMENIMLWLNFDTSIITLDTCIRDDYERHPQRDWTPVD